MIASTVSTTICHSQLYYPTRDLHTGIPNNNLPKLVYIQRILCVSIGEVSATNTCARLYVLLIQFEGGKPHQSTT